MTTALVLVRGSPTLGHQHGWGAAFARGLRRHGWTVEVSTMFRPAHLAVFWGVRRELEMAEQRRRGGQICILERGYLGDRFRWASVSFGGRLNGRAIFRGPFADPSRWQRHFAHLMRPWRERGDGYALLIGQVPGDAALKGADVEAFYARATAALSERGLEVRWRPHPQACARSGAALPRPLEEDLDGARLVVTWNSNAAVDAVIAGVPTIAMDEGSMAWDVTGHALDRAPPTPPREAWAQALAWKQWTMDEMASGECWDAVGRAPAAATASDASVAVRA